MVKMGNYRLKFSRIINKRIDRLYNLYFIYLLYTCFTCVFVGFAYIRLEWSDKIVSEVVNMLYNTMFGPGAMLLLRVAEKDFQR